MLDPEDHQRLALQKLRIYPASTSPRRPVLLASYHLRQVPIYTLHSTYAMLVVPVQNADAGACYH